MIITLLSSLSFVPPSKWEAFRDEIGKVQGQHVPVNMNGKAGRIIES